MENHTQTMQKRMYRQGPLLHVNKKMMWAWLLLLGRNRNNILRTAKGIVTLAGKVEG